MKNHDARAFYEAEALRGGWTVRQLDRQIASQFYERTALSRDKATVLRRGARAKPEDAVSPEEEIKDPYVLGFLALKDEYSESDLEAALIAKLEAFLLELGGEFAFVGQQRRIRIGDEWYRVDLLFFHRRLRCLIIIDLELGKFTHVDAGQMHLYLNYAREQGMNSTLAARSVSMSAARSARGWGTSEPVERTAGVRARPQTLEGRQTTRPGQQRLVDLVARSAQQRIGDDVLVVDPALGRGRGSLCWHLAPPRSQDTTASRHLSAGVNQ